MSKAADSLCERHREFVPLIAAVEHVEESVDEGHGAPRDETLRLHDAFAHGLIPHAVGEGRTVFPVLREITGSSHDSTEMNKDHREIARLTDELERAMDELERSAAAAPGSGPCGPSSAISGPRFRSTSRRRSRSASGS